MAHILVIAILRLLHEGASSDSARVNVNNRFRYRLFASIIKRLEGTDDDVRLEKKKKRRK